MQKQVVYSSRNAIQYIQAPELGAVAAPSPATPLRFETLDQPGTAGQGLQIDAEVRKRLEDAAQDRLMNYYRDKGWVVTDTRQNRPYDAVADKGTERLYLEAKGTQNRGESVIVTRSEVLHARQHPGECVMGIWDEMNLVDGVVDHESGKFRIVPVAPGDQDLRPRDFDWIPPADPQ